MCQFGKKPIPQHKHKDHREIDAEIDECGDRAGCWNNDAREIDLGNQTGIGNKAVRCLTENR